MEKVIYWLKKLGILRSGFFTAKGDAKKIVEMDIDSELYQSDKEIEGDKQKKSSENGGDNKQEKEHKKDNRTGKIVFWIFAVIGGFFIFIFLFSTWSLWTIIGIIMWSVFLRWLWVHITGDMFAIGKILVFGAIAIVLSFVFVPSEDGADVDTQKGGQGIEVKNEKKYLEEDVENDHIVQFLLTLREDTGIDFSKIQNDEIVWTGGPGLQLQKSKSFGVEGLSANDFDRLQQFFLDLGANDGGLGFTFVPPAGTKSSGFALTDEVNSGMMCVLIGIDNDGVMVGCGWGPTQNPNKDK